jgi:NAD(P)H-dependent FMN reductase
MQIVLISGSHRKNSESGRVADYLAGRLNALHSVKTDVMKLDGNPLPLWDESAWDASSDLTKLFAPYAQRLRAADGLVVIAPEWAGMAAAAIKNFMLYTHESMVGHKPALLVAVSAGRGGSYPIAEMRASSYKNNKICYLPEHLLVQGVGGVFKGETPASKDDEYIRGRADFALGLLVKYTAALATLRAGGDVFNKNYPYGM